MTDGHENEAQSPCKNLQGRPICSPKNLDFSRLRNQIRMRSLVPRERNKEHKLHHFLPEKNLSTYSLRKPRPFKNFKARTNRFKNTFFPAMTII